AVLRGHGPRAGCRALRAPRRDAGRRALPARVRQAPLARPPADQPYRSARRPAGVAEQRVAEAAAAEHPPVGQRYPVTPAGDARVDAAHVQGALRIAAEGGAALEFEVHREVVVRATRRLAGGGKLQHWHGVSLCARKARAAVSGARLTGP